MTATLLVLGLAIRLLLLLMTDWIDPEATAFFVLASLAASGQVSAKEAFSCFSSAAAVSIVTLLIIPASLVQIRDNTDARIDVFR